MSTSVVVPWRSNRDPHRESAWQMVRDHWSGWEVHTADDRGQPFSRAASINVAVREYPADVYVVCDADVICPHAQVHAAVDDARRSPGMVIAFERWAHLTEQGTQYVLDGYIGDWEPFVDVAIDWSVSACICFSHETWETTGGFDPRFRGWGMEDVAFEIACRTLAGPTRRIPGTAWHLYHGSEPNRPVENVEILDQYRDAADNRDAMRELLARV